MLIYYYLDELKTKRYSTLNHVMDLIQELSSRYGMKDRANDKSINKNEEFKIFLYTLKIPQKTLRTEFSSDAINIQNNSWPLFFKNFIFKNLRVPLRLPNTTRAIMNFYELPVLKSPKNLISILNIQSITNYILPDFFDTKIDIYNVIKEINSADQIIVPSNMVKEELVHSLFIREERIHAIPTGIPECFFVNPAAPHIELPEKYMVFTGKITMHKNLEKLIKNFDKVAPKDFSLVIIGDIDSRYENNQHAIAYKKELQKLTETMKNNRIIFTGYMERIKIASILKNSCGLVDPSYHNNFPDSIMEALAVGVPVLASDIPHHKTLCKDCIEYINPSSDISMAEALEAFTKEESLKTKKTIEERKEIAQKYSWNKIIEQYSDYYKSLG